MKLLVSRFILLLTFMVTAAQCYSKPQDYDFYLKLGSGVSVSQSPNIVAVYPPWTPAMQGYNAPLGSCPIASFGVGCQLFDVVDLEVSMSNRSVFEYRQFQTPTSGGDSYTREFDLNVTPIIFSANILGLGIPHLHADMGLGILYPMIGAGIGVSNLLITNYRTTGLPAIGDSSPFQTFSAENQYTLRKNFTYTLLAGVEYNYDQRWAIGTGYRWLNAGDFKGPQYQRVMGGSAVDVADDQWSMRFRAQEWFIEFKIFI